MKEGSLKKLSIKGIGPKEKCKKNRSKGKLKARYVGPSKGRKVKQQNKRTKRNEQNKESMSQEKRQEEERLTLERGQRA